jgi:hypothetical protein
MLEEHSDSDSDKEMCSKLSLVSTAYKGALGSFPQKCKSFRDMKRLMPARRFERYVIRARVCRRDYGRLLLLIQKINCTCVLLPAPNAQQLAVTADASGTC